MQSLRISPNLLKHPMAEPQGEFRVNWPLIIVFALMTFWPTNKKSKDLIPGGLAEGKSPEDFDQQELAKGIKVEMEHTSDKQIATEIAMDHLVEDPNYYKKLAKIESNPQFRPVPLMKEWIQSQGPDLVGMYVIHPKDFLGLTTRSQRELRFIEMEALDIDKYNYDPAIRDTMIVHPFLQINKRGNVVGFEGRHRAFAVLNSGETQYKIAVIKSSRDKQFDMIPKVWSNKFNTGFTYRTKDENWEK